MVYKYYYKREFNKKQINWEMCYIVAREEEDARSQRANLANSCKIELLGELKWFKLHKHRIT